MVWYGMVWYGMYVGIKAQRHNLNESGSDLRCPNILYQYQRARRWYGASLHHSIIWYDMIIVCPFFMYVMVWYGMVCMYVCMYVSM